MQSSILAHRPYRYTGRRLHHIPDTCRYHSHCNNRRAHPKARSHLGWSSLEAYNQRLRTFQGCTSPHPTVYKVYRIGSLLACKRTHIRQGMSELGSYYRPRTGHTKSRKTRARQAQSRTRSYSQPQPDKPPNKPVRMQSPTNLISSEQKTQAECEKHNLAACVASDESRVPSRLENAQVSAVQQSKW